MSAATIATAAQVPEPDDEPAGEPVDEPAGEPASAPVATAPTDEANLATESVEGVVTSARARLAPASEPPARSLRPSAPPLSRPPVAGSAEASSRSAGAPGSGGPRPTLPARPSDDAALPDPVPLCCAMVQAAVEALRGARPLAQLARWVSPEIFEQLSVRSELTQRVRGENVGTHRAAIRRIRMCRLGDRAAEATVVVDDGPRVRAVAVRLEGHRGQWRATALEIG